jgi:RNA polymerase sigma-70 factor (ECF subfamily)
MAPGASTGPFDPESTQLLLAQAQSGDERALNQLLERCVPVLRRWAHGRLPHYARDSEDTLDLVQEAIMKALQRLDGFVPEHEGALLAYLRTTVWNLIRDQIRRHARRPRRVEVPDNLQDEDTSPLEAVIGVENAQRYENALGRLRDDDRQAIFLRLELHYTYDEMRIAMGKPTEGAARVAVRRALGRLAQEMSRATQP